MIIDIRNPKTYIENFLKIKTKKQEIVPFILNEPQKRLYEVIREERKAGKPVRLIILKARQEGFSTLVEGLFFQDSATRSNVDTAIVAHIDEATNNLFQMNKLFFDELPAAMQPMQKTSNAKELIFENPTRDAAEKKKSPGLRSHIRCYTAGGKGIGRSATLINLHMSEFAYWPGDPMATYIGLMQAVPDDPNTCAIIESTANGYNAFKDMWDAAVAGKNGWRPVFFPWFEFRDYRREAVPGTEWTDEEDKLREAYKLDDEQLTWRRWCIETNFNGDVNKFKQEYPAAPEEAFLFSGTPFFDNEKILLALPRAKMPERVGFFEYDYDGIHISGIKWIDDKNGFIRLLRPPEPGVPYVIGGDTAGEGSDRFTGQALDNRTGKQAAVLCHTFSEELYTRQMYCLGMYYNTALLAIETNFSTYPNMELQRLGYPRLYVRERFDTYTGKLQQAFGFVTSPKTRPAILSELHAVMHDAPEPVDDADTLREMLIFAYDENHKPQAIEGEHDDLVLALAIAHHARTQQTTETPEEKRKRAKWAKDMYDDYYAADEEGRRHLIEKWGNPFA